MARRVQICALVGCLVVGAVTLASAAPYGYGKFKYGSAYYHVVSADVTSREICATAHYSPHLTSSRKVIGRIQPVAAVTGTFFAFENQQPVADVVINGELKASGYRGSVLAVDWFGRVKVFDAPVRKEVDFFSYRYALRGMVRILRDGQKCPDPRSQGFRDSRIWGSAARTAVGLTKSGKVIMVATQNSVTLSSLAMAVKSRGAVDAVSLDGGGSTMLYYMGSTKVSPNRPLSTLFMIERRDPFDDLFRDHLARISKSQTIGAAVAAATATGQ